MHTVSPVELVDAIAEGSLIPCLGPGALCEVRDPQTGAPIPARSEELILALNNGQPMAPKLMWEFSRAAMHVELKRGRRSIQAFLDRTYGETAWSRSALHAELARLRLPYILDLNRDRQLQDAYAGTPHTLVRGFARLGGSDYRFKAFQWDQTDYREIDANAIDISRPLLFKPLGSPGTGASYVASDADYVDYLTELMGGLAVPPQVKSHRLGRRYLMIGVRFLRDTERMLVSDLIYGAADPAGWAMIESPTQRELRFCKRHHLTVIDLAQSDLLRALRQAPSPSPSRLTALAAAG